MATIVVADDDPDVSHLTAVVLRRAGHEVVACGDGAQLIAAVRRHLPDVIVTDHQMPGITGLQACEALRGDPVTAGIPVIVASGSIVQAEADRILGAGDQLLTKPFSNARLREAVDTALHRPADQEPVAT